jgi:SAM-dependent methyltransferase
MEYGRSCPPRTVLMAEQFHFDPDTYLQIMRAEVPDYDALQEIVARAAGAVPAETILDLGTGTGETLRHVAARHPHARLVGIDESAAMLDIARRVVPGADLRVARLEDQLPDGSFDVVISALAVRPSGRGAESRLVSPRRRSCYARRSVRPRGCRHPRRSGRRGDAPQSGV